MTFNEGDKVKIAGERKTAYVVRKTDCADGSVLLYGGSINPNGKQGYRSVMPDKLVKVRK